MAGRPAHLVQVLLPVYVKGRDLPSEKFEALAQELSEKFGGVTSFVRAPAEGRWESGNTTQKDDIAVIEVMVETVEHKYWSSLRQRLERELAQEEIVIRCQPMQLL